jgi:hypothetical protein
MTQLIKMRRDEVLALRGLRLPSVALKGLQPGGIYCQPTISVEFQQAAQRYVWRGVESGGTIAPIGAYCGFTAASAQMLIRSTRLALTVFMEQCWRQA